MKWLPNNYDRLISKLHILDLKKAENFILHIHEYLKNFPPKNLNKMEIDRENASLDEEELKEKKFETKFKVILLENIKNII